MDSEFFLALDEIERDKGISRDDMLEKINQALTTAVKKDNPAAADGVVVETDVEKRKVRIYIEKTVVEEVTNPELELTLEQGRKLDPKAEIGTKSPVDMETKKFGRIAAQAAKQVIIQGIREAERGMVFDRFASKEHEVLTGLVSRIDPKTGNVYVKLSTASGMTEGVMPQAERVKGELIREGDHLKVYVVEVRRPTRGPQVMVSRTHPGLVKRLFEQEVPEIADGVVEIRSIAREAGTRSKIAVWSSDPQVDPIGACVGPRSGDHSFRAVVPDNQLSLAIGKEGKNARLAAKLTGCRIDIRPASEMMERSSIVIDLDKLGLNDSASEEESE